MRIDLQILNSIVEQFRSGKSLIELSEQTGISKFRIRHILRKTLGDEYWQLIENILKRQRSSETRVRMSKAAKIRNANPDWAKKVIKTKRERGYFQIHSKRHTRWMIEHHPTRGKKHSIKACVNMQTARRRYYNNGGIPSMLGKTHSLETKEKLRIITKRMWKEGKFQFNSMGFGRSKLEIHIFDDIKKLFPDAQHSYKLFNKDRVYVFDVYIPSIKTFVEINGDYWHLNPKLYEATHYDKYRKVTAQDVWNKDANKRRAAEECGLKLITIWESDASTFEPTSLL